jgi:hypothetical protein
MNQDNQSQQTDLELQKPENKLEGLSQPVPVDTTLPSEISEPLQSDSLHHAQDNKIMVLTSAIIIMLSIANLLPTMTPHISQKNVYRLGAYKQNTESEKYTLPTPTVYPTDQVSEISEVNTGDPEADLADLEKDLSQL